jgi:hypothetical protein
MEQPIAKTVRILVVLMVVLVGQVACSPPNGNQTQHISSDSLQFDGQQPDTGKISINAEFPFGYTPLTQFVYPKHWEGDLENYGHLKMPKGQEFEQIDQWYYKLHQTKTIAAPQPQSIEVLEIGDNFKIANNVNPSAQKSIDSCRYRLPNMGIYECYYSYSRYGNLLLFDPKTNSGKLLNLYANDLGGDSETILRFFYIDKNTITIYEAYYCDDGCTLFESFKISVELEGAIEIEELKK